MKPSQSLAAAVAAVLLIAPAAAQLRAPRGQQTPSTAQPAAAQAPAPAPANEATSTANAEKEAAGKLAAAGWLVLLDRRDWGRAWETSSSVFRASVPLGTWMDNVPRVREPFGALVERVPAESVYKTTLAGRPDGEYVTVNFVSKFDKQEVQEVVTTVRDVDGKWRVTGYSPR